jgi:16S rRNA (uracil1498-N3)-methyltransferase
MAQARRAAAHVFVEDLGDPQLDGTDRHHLGRVLRLRPGQEVSVSDGRGGWRPALYLDDGRLEAAGPVQRPEPRRPAVTVGFAVVKGERPEWAVQKLTELGVDHILPLTTQRTVVRWDGDRAERNRQRLMAVARSAAAQSRRLMLPEVHPLTGLPDAVQACRGGYALAVPGGDAPSLDRPAVFVGPEGGWTPEEEGAAEASVSLGPGILRTETAAVAAGVLLTALRASVLGWSSPRGSAAGS